MFKLKEFYQYRCNLGKKNKVFRYNLKGEYRGLKFFKSSPFKDRLTNIGQGIIYLKASQNNTIITLANLKGKVQCVKSCGHLGFHGKKKRSTKFAIESTLFAIIQKAKESGWSKVAVYLNGFAKGRFYVLNCFKKSLLKFSIIRDITPIPHNGCRPKKLRRG